MLSHYLGSGAQSMQSLEQLQEVLQTAYCLLPSWDDISNLPLSMTTEEICHKLKSLSVYLQFYLDNFLFRARYTGDAAGLNSLRSDLSDILDRIIRLTSHLSHISNYIHYAYAIRSNFDLPSTDPKNSFLHFADVQPYGLNPSADPKPRDTALALLFAFARLLKGMLEQTADEEKVTSIIHDSAIAICRLCASFPSPSPMVTLLAKRSVFWAGIILTESRFPSGKILLVCLQLIVSAHTWIKNQLHQYNLSGHHWNNYDIIHGEEEVTGELMRNSHHCTSFNDIWTVAVGEVSLFYYNATLVTWFFGLNLVRFVHKGGRSLEIS
jgi:hypothetical protein